MNIKPCPFCGKDPTIKITNRYPHSGEHEGEWVDGYTPVCTNMKCLIYDADGKYWLNAEEAMDALNRRPAAYKYTLEELRETDGRPVWCDSMDETSRPSQWAEYDKEFDCCSNGQWDFYVNDAPDEEYGVTWVAYNREPGEE